MPRRKLTNLEIREEFILTYLIESIKQQYNADNHNIIITLEDNEIERLTKLQKRLMEKYK